MRDDPESRVPRYLAFGGGIESTSVEYSSLDLPPEMLLGGLRRDKKIGDRVRVETTAQSRSPSEVLEEIMRAHGRDLIGCGFTKLLMGGVEYEIRETTNSVTGDVTVIAVPLYQPDAFEESGAHLTSAEKVPVSLSTSEFINALKGAIEERVDLRLIGRDWSESRLEVRSRTKTKPFFQGPDERTEVIEVILHDKKGTSQIPHTAVLLTLKATSHQSRDGIFPEQFRYRYDVNEQVGSILALVKELS